MTKHQHINKTIALDFVNAINSHDIERIIELMTEDHALTDTCGNNEGLEAMKLGWPGYFQWFSDYLIDISQVRASGDTVVLFGYASGTYHGETKHWCVPAAWRVVIESDKVKTWQVYTDSMIFNENFV